MTGTWKAGKSKKVTFKYRWYANGKAISKANKSTYTVTARDRGKKIRVRVTGSATGYKSLARTSAVKKIAR